jgi:hypothetical protein
MEHIPVSQIIGILMTGMGNDGAEAMTELRTRGGKTIAEAEETAIVWGMPGELVRAGGADWVVPLPNIAARLQKLVPNDAAHTYACEFEYACRAEACCRRACGITKRQQGGKMDSRAQCVHCSWCGRCVGSSAAHRK